jgi:hypothetical protein
MKKILGLAILTAAFAVSGAAQELNSKGQPVVKSNDNAPVELKAGETIKRGAALGAAKAERAALADVMKNPQKYAGKIVAVEGVIVRSCKKEGCWMELAANKDAKPVRVTFGDHAFFIPLNAAGLNAKAEGVFEVKVLSKEKVDHMVNDDGAKIERNADGTANEITFVASGVELTKSKS